MNEIIIGREPEDFEKYGKKATLYLGKNVVGTGEDAHMTTPVIMDVLRPHVVLITGKRGCGKSFTMGVMLEEILKLDSYTRQRLCGLMIDTQGIFWTMKIPNEKDYSLLAQWNLPACGFDIEVSVPEGQVKNFSEADVDFDSVFSIKPSQLTPDDWLTLFDISINDSKALIFQRALQKLKEDYGLDDIIDHVSKEQGEKKDIESMMNHLYVANSWGIFGTAPMPKIISPGKITILDVSLTPQNVRTLIASIALRHLLIERIKARRKEETEKYLGEPVPFPWIFIDEAHNFAPDSGESSSLPVILKIVKEGRQPGLSMVMATQQPNKLHSDVLSQADIVISHKLTSKEDINALRSIMQTYMLYDIQKYMTELPKWKGVALVLDDNSERIYRIRVRPKQSWHAGASPKTI
ncbi:MAG: ATP-binding protein [Candidatus Aenigmarchaeota archaeon]|nr:ATP-binding protein [Candidatus Aenigmarchaeota archaeon]